MISDAMNCNCTDSHVTVANQDCALKSADFLKKSRMQ